MSDRFLNNRKLTYEEFFSYADLIDFVNDNKIESDDIQQIAQVGYHRIILIYWK